MGEKPEPQERTMRMPQLVQSAGIDCGKRFLDVAVYPGGEQIRLENEPADHQRLVVWLDLPSMNLDTGLSICWSF
jgi:hypothetical protein